MLVCHFVILSFFSFAVGDINRGLLVRYIYYIYILLYIYIIYYIHARGKNDKMTK